jgi:hypothetical protein
MKPRSDDMDLVEQYTASIGVKKKILLRDVKDYIKWETHNGEVEFNPQTSDDVAIRTYLLDCRIRGVSRGNLNRIVASLEHFYAWLKTSGVIVDSPFEKYNLKRAFLDLNIYCPGMRPSLARRTNARSRACAPSTSWRNQPTKPPTYNPCSMEHWKQCLG